MANEKEKSKVVEVSTRRTAGRIVDLNVPPAQAGRPTILDKHTAAAPPKIENADVINVKKHTRNRPKK